MADENINYAKIVEPYVDSFREEISKSYSRKIEFPLKDIKVLLGPKFEERHDTAVYLGLKSSLLRYDIIVDRERRENLIVMRMATIEDWKNLVDMTLGILMRKFPGRWKQFDEMVDTATTQSELRELYFKMWDIILPLPI